MHKFFSQLFRNFFAGVTSEKLQGH